MPPPPSDAGDVTRILNAVTDGQEDAAERLLPLVYEHLQGLARAHMQQERPGHTLQATALVHEAYLKLIGDGETDWSSRGRFYAAAAQAMRRILIDHARRRGCVKRGGDRRRLPLSAADLAAGEEISADLLALDEALSRLSQQDRRLGEVVLLRFFAGLSIEETAAAMELSPRTVKREWSCARAWLYRELSG